MSRARARGALCRVGLLAGLLVGCGASPGVGPRALAVKWQRVADGGFLGGCVHADTMRAVRPGAVEVWRLPAGDHPTRVETLTWGWPAEGAPATALACDGPRLRLTLGDDTGLGIVGEAIAWRGEPPANEAWPAPASPAPPASWQPIGTLPDGRTALAGLSGWGLRAGETLVEWRRTAGDLRDAAWDGTTLFAVGAEGLWRWQPGRPAAVPVPLPAALAGRPLIRVFRDGPYLWVQDEAGTGWPLGGVRSGEASLVGAPGPLPRADAGLRVRLGDWRVNAVRGEPRVRIGADDDLAAPIETNGPVHALLPLGADAVLVAAGTQVMLLRLDDPPRREAIWPLGVEVIALFLEGERLIGVTRHAGFLEARVQWPGPPPAPISAAD